MNMLTVIESIQRQIAKADRTEDEAIRMYFKGLEDSLAFIKERMADA